MSDYERVKEAVSLKDYAEAHLGKMGRFYVCPSCGSGTGPSKSPAFSIKGDMFKCFSCGAGGDVFDLAGVLERTDDKARQLEAVAEWGGVALGNEARMKHERKAFNAERTPNKRRIKEAAPDHSEGIKREALRVSEWAANVDHPEAVAYIESRGFTLDQAKAWGMGYDPARRRLVIPYRGSRHYHIDRDVTGTAANKYDKPKADAVGKQPFENPAALSSKVLFVVEGLIDALAVEACGFASTALNGTGWHDAAGRIASERYEGTVLIALDADAAGREAALKMEESLKAAGIVAWRVRPFDDLGCKDAGEAYKKQPEALRNALREEHDSAIRSAEIRAEERYNEALRSLRVLDPSDVLQRLYLLSDAVEPVPTGFPSFDRITGGGLMGGYLYILGAVSSLGKTTLTLQIADGLAAQGHPVLFVTIEQGASEIVAKSLSRILRTNKDERGRYHVMSAQDITSKARRDQWSDQQTAGLLRASEAYTRTIAPNMRILEGYEQPRVADIMAAARTMQERTGKAPAVFIDYLQLLAAPTDRDTDKQAIDKNVMSLRHLARDLKAPVFAISSLNRGSYSGAIDLDSFKESGAIEYGADVLLGLQPEGIADKLDEVAEGKAKKAASKLTEEVKRSSERACELVILKNRHGQITGTRGGIPLTFYPVTNYFEEKQQ